MKWFTLEDIYRNTTLEGQYDLFTGEAAEATVVTSSRAVRRTFVLRLTDAGDDYESPTLF